MARECLDPDMLRAWLPEKLALTLEFDRFIVEPGCGMAVFVLRPARVCGNQLSVMANSLHDAM
jgi:hypothetical protein